MAALSTVCNTVDNMDIEKFIPALVSCIARPSEVRMLESLLFHPREAEKRKTKTDFFPLSKNFQKLLYFRSLTACTSSPPRPSSRPSSPRRSRSWSRCCSAASASA